jgi:hypothetical protein
MPGDRHFRQACTLVFNRPYAHAVQVSGATNLAMTMQRRVIWSMPAW